MAWADYWQSHMEGVEAVEEQTDTAWEAALALLILWERRMRRRIARAARGLPLSPAGTFDTTDRSARRAFLGETRRAARDASDGLGRDLGGLSTTGDIPRLPPSRRGSFRTGMLTSELERTQRTAQITWERTRQIERRDRERMRRIGMEPVPEPGRAAGPVTTAEVEAVEREADAMTSRIVQHRRQRERAGHDLEEIRQDALINILRNSKYSTDRAVEVIGRLSNRFGTPDDLLDYLADEEPANATARGEIRRAQRETRRRAG